MNPRSIYLALLHDQMVDKRGAIVTTSVTLIDTHDIARSCRTYGVNNYFICHSSPLLRELVLQLTEHWQTGFGGEYNPNRQDALSHIRVVESLKQAVSEITELHNGTAPITVATSGRQGANRRTFAELRSLFHDSSDQPVLLLFGTGWGMSDELLAEADVLLEPVYGPTTYNFLSVRSAVAIILDRLLSPQHG